MRVGRRRRAASSGGVQAARGCCPFFCGREEARDGGWQGVPSASGREERAVGWLLIDRSTATIFFDDVVRRGTLFW